MIDILQSQSFNKSRLQNMLIIMLLELLELLLFRKNPGRKSVVSFTWKSVSLIKDVFQGFHHSNINISCQASNH